MKFQQVALLLVASLGVSASVKIDVTYNDGCKVKADKYTSAETAAAQIELARADASCTSAAVALTYTLASATRCSDSNVIRDKIDLSAATTDLTTLKSTNQVYIQSASVTYSISPDVCTPTLSFGTRAKECPASSTTLNMDVTSQGKDFIFKAKGPTTAALDSTASTDLLLGLNKCFTDSTKAQADKVLLALATSVDISSSASGDRGQFALAGLMLSIAFIASAL